MACSTMRQPPFGIIARLQGTSVWRPTTTLSTRGVDVAGREGVDVGRGMGVHVVDALLALHGQVVVVEVLPQVLGLLGGRSQNALSPSYGV